jgi:hypothetical protein
MPVYKVTHGGVEIDDGAYPATCTKVEEMRSATPQPGQDPRFLKWAYLVRDGSPEGVEVTATSAAKFTEANKPGKWATALTGRKFKKDDDVDTDMFHGRRCLVAIAHNEKGYAYIESVLPLPLGDINGPPRSGPVSPSAVDDSDIPF